MVIQTNVSALISCRESAKTNRAMKKTLEKLSSGYRINRSADDASGLAVSERMRFYCTEYGRCHTNAKEGLNLAKTADGALAEVNDMLRRARELCIQAENGTYSEQELASISDEMNELFGEIDRITEGSFFNEIQLFRGAVGPDFHYEYDEVFTPVDPAKGTELWGSIDFVETGEFQQATPPKSATATFHLNGIKEPKDLDGKTLTINNKTYFFSDKYTNTIPGAQTYVWKGYSSVQSLLTSVFRNTMWVQNSKNETLYPNVSVNGDTVTVTAPLGDINETRIIDGAETLLVSERGAGAWANGISITGSGGSSLEEVDPAENNLVYGNLTGSFTIGKSANGLMDDKDVSDIKQNVLIVAGTRVELSAGNFTKGMTGDQVGQEVVRLIDKTLKASNFSNPNASYKDGKLNISFDNKGSTTSPRQVTIHEERPYKDTERENGNIIKAPALDVTVNVKTSEKGEVSEIKIPDNLSKPFGVKIGSSYYFYYDSTKNPLTDATHTSVDRSPYATLIDTSKTSSLTGGSVYSDLVGKLSSYITNAGGKVEVNGNTITATDPAANHSLGLKNSLGGYAITATAYKPFHRDFTTELMFGTSSSGNIGINDYGYCGLFQQEVSVSFAVDGNDVSALAGKGFNINGYKWAFVNNGEPAAVPDGYTKVELSGFADINALADDLQSKMNGYTVKFDAGKLTFDWYKPASNYYTTYDVTVTDGYKGSILKESNGVKFEGGADTGHSQKKIDFSSLTADDMDGLLGKGLRINCASCEGEFINILFVHEKGDMPESFEIKIDADNNRLPNDTTDPNAQTVTIRNYAVELSKISSPQQIVSSIVQQLSGQLGHFTTVQQDPDNPLILLAQDKRYGIIEHPKHDSRGEVVGGVEANFTYSVNIRKVEDYPEDGSVALKNNNVEIYVGSEPDPQIIPIHLPYIDLKTLRLRPPETVDLNDAEQDASNWLNRVDQANLFISKSRGVIGADHNRLESAVQALSHAKENITDAESRIRDTDMAEEMMEHIKLQILTQSQQSMLSQALAQPQQVLRLIS